MEYQKTVEDAALRYAHQLSNGLHYHPEVRNKGDQERYTHFMNGFNEAFRFMEWQRSCRMQESGVELHMQYKMFKNETNKSK